MQPKLIIFDLDGTVLDTLDDMTDAANYALIKNGFSARTRDEIRSFVGKGVKNLINRAIPEDCDDQAADRVYADFLDAYNLGYNNKTVPFPHIYGLIEKLKSKKIHVAVNSNKNQTWVEKLISFHFDGLVDAALGTSDTVPRKPNPQGAFMLMKRFGASPRETIYIGDSEVDILTAINAGLTAILVDWGFRTGDQLSEFMKENGVSPQFPIVSNCTRLAKLIF